MSVGLRKDGYILPWYKYMDKGLAFVAVDGSYASFGIKEPPLCFQTASGTACGQMTPLIPMRCLTPRYSISFPNIEAFAPCYQWYR